MSFDMKMRAEYKDDYETVPRNDSLQFSWICVLQVEGVGWVLRSTANAIWRLDWWRGLGIGPSGARCRSSN
jgi:hypothetical protein